LRTQRFTATVTGTSNTAVIWRVNGVQGGNATFGTIDSTGLYTAPATVPASTVTVTASSQLYPTKFGAATVRVVAVRVTVAPASVELPAGKTQQFTATVTGPSNTSVTWSVAGILGGNSTVGTISSSGLYTAPATVSASTTVTIAATSVADSSAFGTASVRIVLVQVSVSPASVELVTGASQQFTATVTGSTDTSVIWSVNGVAGGNATVGTISNSGVYTAPATVPSTPVLVRATSVADSTKSATASVTIASVEVSISPPGATLLVRASQQFTAGVTGATNTAVNWTVNGIAGGNATIGTVSTSGLYTAPAAVPSPSTVSVRATSVADSTKSAAASVTIILNPLSITTATLPLGVVNTSYSAILSASGGAPPYTWSLIAGSLPAGLSLSSNSITGAPTAGGSTTFTLRVADSAGSSATATFTINISSFPPTVQLGYALPNNLTPAQQQPIQLTLMNSYPFAASVEMTLSFTPNAINSADDPNVMFTSGGRSITFPIPPNSPLSTITVPNAQVQTGTVAGTIVLTAVARLASADVQPITLPPYQITIDQLAPTLMNDVRMIRKPYGFDVEVTGFSNTREISQATFRFTARDGGNVQGLEFTVPLSSESNAWYQSPPSAALGSSFHYVQAFVVWGDVANIQSVSVTLSNTRGNSGSRTGGF